MKTEIINGISVTVVENYSDMLKVIDECEVSHPIVPLAFDIKCGERTISSSDGFDSN